jgi:hypothetical protein
MDKDRIWNGAGAFTGVIFVVLVLAGMAIAGDPGVEPSDSSSEIARAFVDRSDDTGLGSTISVVGILFFFPFLAYLRNRLRKAEGDDGWLANTAYGGGLVTAAMLLVMLSLNLAKTSVSDGTDPVVAKVLVTLTWNFSLVFGPPMIALVLGASFAILRYSALPQWLGWLGFLVSLTLLMPWIGMLVTLPWILLVSLTMTYQAWNRQGAISQLESSPNVI